MFYIFFPFLLSFMLYASGDIEEIDQIEEITQSETIRVLYIDDSTVNLKMTQNIVKIYNSEPENASLQIALTTRKHGNNLELSELQDKHMVWPHSSLKCNVS